MQKGMKNCMSVDYYNMLMQQQTNEKGRTAEGILSQINRLEVRLKFYQFHQKHFHL